MEVSGVECQQEGVEREALDSGVDATLTRLLPCIGYPAHGITLPGWEEGGSNLLSRDVCNKGEIKHQFTGYHTNCYV